MSGTNIFMQVIAATGPVIGEGLKDGFQGSIELDSFTWAMTAQKQAEFLSAGNVVASMGSLIGLSPIKSYTWAELSITKKFDVASPILHTYLDNHVLILSVSITVLHIKPGGRTIHQPGFVLAMQNGYFTKSSLALSSSGGAAELTETMAFNGTGITISYVKSLGKDNVPTNPFVAIKPSSGG
jgi:type VI protein secretion system component Hcp